MPATTVLDLGAAEAGRQIAKQRDFALGTGGEIGVAPLAGRRDQPAVHVVQQRDSQAGSRSDQRDIAVADRFATLQSVHLGVFENGNGVGHRHQVVENSHALQIERLRDDGPVDAPGHMGQSCGIVDDRARDTKARPIDRCAFDRLGLKKRRHHRGEIAEIESGE